MDSDNVRNPSLAHLSTSALWSPVPAPCQATVLLGVSSERGSSSLARAAGYRVGVSDMGFVSLVWFGVTRL